MSDDEDGYTTPGDGSEADHTGDESPPDGGEVPDGDDQRTRTGTGDVALDDLRSAGRSRKSATPGPEPGGLLRRRMTMPPTRVTGDPVPLQKSASTVTFSRLASSRKPAGLRLEGVSSAIPDEEAAVSPQVSSIREDSRADTAAQHSGSSHLMNLSSADASAQPLGAAEPPAAARGPPQPRTGPGRGAAAPAAPPPAAVASRAGQPTHDVAAPPTAAAAGVSAAGAATTAPIAAAPSAPPPAAAGGGRGGATEHPTELSDISDLPSSDAPAPPPPVRRASLGAAGSGSLSHTPPVPSGGALGGAAQHAPAQPPVPSREGLPPAAAAPAVPAAAPAAAPNGAAPAAAGDPPRRRSSGGAHHPLLAEPAAALLNGAGGGAGPVFIGAAPFAAGGRPLSDAANLAPPLPGAAPQGERLHDGADVLARLISSYAELRRAGPEAPPHADSESDTSGFDAGHWGPQRRSAPRPPAAGPGPYERDVDAGAGVRERAGRDRAALERALAARREQETSVERAVLSLVLRMARRSAPEGTLRHPPRHGSTAGAQLRRMGSPPPVELELHAAASDAGRVPLQSRWASATSLPAGSPPRHRTAPTAAGVLGFDALHPGSAAAAFSAPGDLEGLCQGNLQRYVVMRAEPSDPLTGGGSAPRSALCPAACRLALCDVLGCVLGALRHQGAQEHPVSTYFVQTAPGVGGELMEVIAAVAHSLPMEQVPLPPDATYPGGATAGARARSSTFRIEYWVRRCHLLECAAALHSALRDLEGMCADILTQQRPETDTAVFAARGARCVELLVVPGSGVGARQPGPAHSGDVGAALLGETVAEALRDDVLAGFYGSTGRHAQPAAAMHFLSQALQELVLDDVVRNGVVSRALRLMGGASAPPPAAPAGASAPPGHVSENTSLLRTLDKISAALPPAPPAP